MRRYIFVLSATVTVALLTLFFGSLTAAAAPPIDLALRADVGPDVGRVNTAVVARRAISIPFGIDTLSITGERNIRVEGHGMCPEDAHFKLRVSIRQDSARAHTRGYSENFRCEGEQEEASWTVNAHVFGPFAFESEQDAEVCATAIVYPRRGGAVVNQWCKTVVVGPE